MNESTCNPSREVPARLIPVPQSVSPQMRAVIAQPHDPAFSHAPDTTEGWKAKVAAASRKVEAVLPELRERFGVTVEPTEVGGVKAFNVTPAAVPEANRDRLLINLHGSVRVLFPGESGTREGILMAGFAGYRVLSVDYRMPPDHPFPAALDDSVAVYRALLETHEPGKIGIFGTSAGGSLTCTTLLRAKMEGLPMPGAISLGTPTVDLTDEGDSYYINEHIDNAIATRDGFIRASVALYADGRDLTDSLLSPIYGDVSGFPLTILTSGTRDLYLSNTVRMHRKLRAAGIEADLQIWEGQSHAQYQADVTAPETKEYHDEIARFFDLHMA